jgi:xanthine dehydrogenase accessory factor
MSLTWIDAVVRAAGVGPVVRAVVIDAKGSTPREVGAWMLIGVDHLEGTIGGGALEHACVARARSMLADGAALPWHRVLAHFHLGPELNQCCGGAVMILLERFGPLEVAALGVSAEHHGEVSAIHSLAPGAAITFGPGRATELGLQSGSDTFVEPLGDVLTPVIIYGAGHVGRALVRALDGLPFAVTWCDAVRAREMADLRIREGDLPAMARAAPHGAYHLVMTHSHTLDEAIVAAVLHAGSLSYLGLIGSATKAARFRQRLLKAGIEPCCVAQIHCPIGLPGLMGKAPAVIAASVAADLLLRRQKRIDPGTAVQ